LRAEKVWITDLLGDSDMAGVPSVNLF
jgi:hypothetical protein